MAIWHQQGQSFATGFSEAPFPSRSLQAASVYFSFFPPAFLKFFSFHISPEIHCSSSEFPTLKQPVLKRCSWERQYKWNLCCSFCGAGTTLHRLVWYQKKNKTNLQEWAILFLSSLKKLWEWKNKAANSNELHRTPHPCVLLPREQDEKRNIRSTWNSAPNLQTSYHDCTCKLVR